MPYQFAEIILPLPIRSTFTFTIPADLPELAVGHRVEVQFGPKKRYTGIVFRMHNETPEVGFKIKPIISLLDDKPVVTSVQLELWQQMCDYYLCTLGDVMNVALPAGIKLSSETIFLYNNQLKAMPDLAGDAAIVAEALQNRQEMTYNEVQSLLGKNSIQTTINALLSEKVLLIKEELKEVYKPRTQLFVEPLFSEDKSELDAVFEKVKRAPRQAEIILVLLHWMQQGLLISTQMVNERLPNSTPTLRVMEQKQLLRLVERQVSRVDTQEEWETHTLRLSDAQENAYTAVKTAMTEKQVTLLHGVTGSGKTLIYIQLIEEVIAAGGQVLYMVPEIALTTQLVRRVQKYFGEKAGVYHSNVDNNYKVELWQSVLQGKSLVISARSGIFLPFNQLQLIIIDEEHEYSYKQNEPAPRYHARETAILLGGITGCKILLGSATPSLESYFNAKQGRYGLVELTERYGESKLPQIKLIDRRLIEHRKGQSSHFSPSLIQEIMLTLANQKQVIIFQNRRGFSPVLTCNLCGWTKRCINCDVTMPYHKYNHSFMCHYCGWSDPADPACPACGNIELSHIGFGTEKVEEELKILFPEAEIARMDLDTVKGKRALADMIYRLESGQIDILVGTQLVSKGLDFEGVELVGIVSADQLARYPDFRTSERAFQMMVQVSGRSGRASESGKVLIQYEKIDPALLQQISLVDYQSFYQRTIEERYRFKYPPYCKLIRITFRHKKVEICSAAALNYVTLLKEKWGSRIIGPAPGLIARIRNYFIYEVLIKVERKKLILSELKADTKASMETIRINKDYKSIDIRIDVDPV
jgi:primosomal protein N' (replication factor Y)